MKRLLYSKQHIVEVCLPVVLLTFTFFVFGPTEIYISNESQFWFSFLKVIPIIITAFFSASLFFILLLLLLPSKVRLVINSIILGIAIALYVQGNFLIVNYGQLDGTPINWSEFKLWGGMNLLIWIAIVTISTFVSVKKVRIAKKVLLISTIVILGTQIVTLGVLVMTTSFSEKNDYYLSSKSEFLFSEKGNVVVLVADGFDGIDFSKAIKEDTSYRKMFDGFTFFENTIGTSLYTEESMMTILTGNQLGINSSFKEGVEKCYNDSDLYEILEQEGYDTSIYEAKTELIPKSMANKLENMSYEEVQISSNLNFGKMIYKLVAFKYMPHLLKPFFWMATADFDDLKGQEDNFTWDNISFYNKLIKEMSSIPNNKKFYKLYHIQGPHPSANMTRDCEPIDKVIDMNDVNYKQAQQEQTLGTIKILTTFIEKLKEANLYDSTTIVFLADHGWDIRSNPLLLVKPEKCSGELEISSAPISMIEDYMPTVLTFIKDGIEQKNNIFNIPSDVKRTRPFLVYDINADRTYESIQKYCGEDFINYEDWNLSEIIKAKENLYANYKLGKTVNFSTNDDLAEKYIYYGIDRENWGAWTDGKKAALTMKLNNKKQDVIVDIKLAAISTGQQRVICKVNGEIVYDKNQDNNNITFVINEGLIKNGKLLMELELPEAQSPLSLGEGMDSRLLGIGILEMTLKAEVI